jgi:cell division protein FtsB
MKWLVSVLVVLLLVLQYDFWSPDDGLPGVWHMRQAVEAQRQENAQLSERNKALEAEVDDLKQGLAAIEERARTELGMIKKGETFYQVVGK